MMIVTLGVIAVDKVHHNRRRTGRTSGHGLLRQMASLLPVAIIGCAIWLTPRAAAAATDTYYLQNVASTSVCVGSTTTNQTASANASPTGATVTISLPFSEAYHHTSWTAAGAATSLADDMYTVPFAADSTISSLYLYIAHTWNSTNSPDQFAYAKFYDMDSAAPCPGFEQGVLIGQTAPLRWGGGFSSIIYDYQLKLENVFYNIPAGHRIRIELWTLLEGPYGAPWYNHVTMSYGSGTTSRLTVFQTPPSTDINTVGPGTAPADVTIAPGSPATDLDAFTLQTSAGVDTVQGVTVTLTPDGSARAIRGIQITSDDGAIIYGELLGPLATATIFDIPLTTPISATTTEVSYKIRILPQLHAGMPAPPGAAFVVQGEITHLASLYSKVYNDTPDMTVTIDNGSPANPVWGTLANGDGQNTLNWTNPADSDFSDILILRGTASVTATPVEGTTYLAGATLGSSTVIAAGNLQTFTDTGRTNDTGYYYRIFARDLNGNYSTGLSAGPIIPGTNACIVGNGVNPANKIIGISDSNWTDLDTFTLQSSPSASVTSMTITLPPGTGNHLSMLQLTSSSGTVYRTVDTFTGDTITFSGLAIPITGSASSYKVQIKPKQSSPPPAGTETPLTGSITAITLGNPDINITYNDTESATVTIDHKAPANPALQYVIPADSRVNFNWTCPADSDLYGTFILRNTAPVTDAPQDGTAYSLYSNIGTSNIMYQSSCAPSSVVTWGDNSTVNGTTYYYKIFSRDVNRNYSTGISVGPVTPHVTVTVGNGTDPANTVNAPGSSAASVDAFTLQSTSAVSINSVTVTLSSGAQDVLGSIRIASGDGLTVYGSIVNPASDTVTIPTTGLVSNATRVEYRVEIIPKTHANMPAVPGAEAVVTGRVTEITAATSSNNVYNDTTSATLTVDNLSPGNPAGAAAVPMESGFSVSWTNPGNADFNSFLVVRSIAPLSDVPAEGVAYPAGALIGTSSVVYEGNGQSFIERSLNNGATYYYHFYALDTHGNYSTGNSIGPLQPQPNVKTVAGSAAAIMQGLDVIDVNMPYTDDANGNGTCAVEYKLSSASIWTPWINGISRSATSCVTTITGLTAGNLFDVRMSYGDSDGVLGEASQTVTGIVALSLIQTTAGNVTASFDPNYGPTTIVVWALYTNDYNYNNSCQLEYKRSSDSNWTSLEGYIYRLADGQYFGLFDGLQQMTRYDVRVTFIDPDGVNGETVQIVAGLVMPSQKNPRLIHNSINAGGTVPIQYQKNYWAEQGGWGVPGGMYGEFTCKTCHEKRTGNAAGIKTFIMGKPVLFKGATGPYSFGDDSAVRPDPQGTYRICEACHTQTSGMIGWDEVTQQPILGPIHRSFQTEPGDHFNGQDCTVCHKHDNGFAAGPWSP